MNKVYKLVWSRTRHMYVAVCEFAKSHTKAPSVGVISKTVVAGVLASVISCGAVMPMAHAQQNPGADANYVIYYGADGSTIQLEGASGTTISNVAAGALSAASTEAVNGAQLYEVTQQFDEFQASLSRNSGSIATAQADINRIKTQNLNLQSQVNTLDTEVSTGFNVNIAGAKVKTVNPESNFINFVAGDGVSLTNDNGSVKVTVAADGVVQSDNKGAITGGLAYTELRPANGNYVAQTNTTSANLTALDTQLKTNVDNLATEVTNRTNADTALGGRIDTLETNMGTATAGLQDSIDAINTALGTASQAAGEYTDANNTVNQNLKALDDQLKDTSDALATETIARQNADNDLLQKIGTIVSNGDYVDKDASVSDNLVTLDGAVKANADAIGTPLAGNYIQTSQNVYQNMALLDTGLKGVADNIGTLPANGNYITTNNTVYQNIAALDTQLKNVNTTMEDVVSYDGSEHTTATLSGQGGTVLSNVKAGVLSASSSEAVNGAQLYATNQNIAGFAADINRNKQSIREMNTSVTAALDSVATTSLLVNTLDDIKADASLNNLTSAGRQVIAAAAANAVQEYMAGQVSGSNSQSPISPVYPTNYVAPQTGENGNPVYEVTTGPNGETVSGDTTVTSPVVPAAPVVSSVSPTIVTTDGDSNVNTTFSTRSFAAPMAPTSGDDDSGSTGGLRSVSPSAGTNYVVYDDADATKVTLEGAAGTGTVLTNLAAGELSAASTDAVTGSQLYEVTQQFDEFQASLSRNSGSIATAQADINRIKTQNLNLQSQVNTLDTQMTTGLNVTVDGALVKNMNPDSPYVNFVTGDNVTIEDDNGSVKISANNDGQVRSGDQGLVSGATVYQAIRNAIGSSEGGTAGALAGKVNVDASNVGVNADDGDNTAQWGSALGTGNIGTPAGKLVTDTTIAAETRPTANGNYISMDASAGVNLTSLDSQVKGNADNIAALQTTVTADTSGLKDLSNITEAGETVIRDIAQGAVKVVAGTNTTVTEGTQGDAKTYAVNVTTNGTVANGNTGIVTGGAVYSAINDAVRDITSGTAVSDELAAAVAEKIGNGVIESGNTGLITGGTAYDYIENRLGSFGAGTVGAGVTDGTALGDGSSVNADGGTAVGNGATVNGENGTAVGKDSVADADESTAVGHAAEALGDGSFAGGTGATADGDGSVALGRNANADGQGAIAIGDSSNAEGNGTTALGDHANASATDATAVGHGANADGENSSAFGTNASATGLDSTVGGADATATAEGATSFGAGASATGTESTALGHNASASNDNTTAIGSGANASGADATAVGQGSTASGDGSAAFGTGSSATGENSTALGVDAVAGADGALAVGNGAQATGENSTAVGTNAASVADGASSFGNGAQATGTNSSSFGLNAAAVGDGSTVMGAGAVGQGEGSSAFGINANAAGDHSVAIGDNATAAGAESVALGHNATAVGDGSMGLGSNTVAQGANSVALGSNSTATDENVISVGHSSTDLGPDGNPYGTDLYRRITNVADGTSAHDVATVGQIKDYVAGTNVTLTADGQNAIGQDKYKINVNMTGQVAEGNTGIVSGGAIYTAIQESLGHASASGDGENSVALGDGASVTGKDGVGIGSGTDVSGEGGVGIGAGTNAIGDQSTAIGQNASALGHDSTAVGANSTASADGASAFGANSSASGENSTALGTNSNATGDNSVALGADSVANEDNVISVGHRAGDLDLNGNPYSDDLFRRITNVADGTSAHDAATVGQTVAFQDSDTITAEQVGTNEIGQKLIQMKVKFDGDIAEGNTGLVSGGQIYNAFQSFSSLGGGSVADGVNNGVAVGQGSSVSADGGTAVGSDASASSEGATAVGQNASGSGEGSVAVGRDADASGAGAVAMGDNANASGQDAIGIGHNANASADGGVAMGGNSTASGTDAIGIGHNASATGEGAVALGGDAVAQGDNSTAIGRNAFAGGENSTALGANSYVSGDNSTGLGANTIVTGTGSVAVGNDSVASDNNVVSFGHKADDLDTNGNPYGQDFYRRITNIADGVDDQDAVTMHQLKNAGEVIAQSMGNGKAEEGNGGLITGDTLYQSVTDLQSQIDSKVTHGVSINSINPETDTNYDSKGATGDDAVAIGVSAGASGNESIALGHNANASGVQSIAVGTGNQVSGDHSGAFGDPNTVTGTGSYAFGNDNTVSGNDMFVLGNNVTNATGNNSVVLGAGSDGSQNNVVSVGAAGAERKIVHVADGEIVEGSTDAVNGGQIYNLKKDLQDAANIDIDKWAAELGKGEVAEGDTNLVNGGTVFNAIKNLNVAQGSITADIANGQLNIGGTAAYDGVDTVNIAKSDGTSRYLTGVATNPNDPTSAANVAYVDAMGQNIVNGVNQGFAKMDRKVERVGANAAAMASLSPGSFEGDEKFGVAAAVGNYRSATAGAVGVFYRPQDNIVLNARGSFGTDENMFGAGVYVGLNKGNVPHVTKTKMVSTINAQAQKITEYENRISQLENVVRVLASSVAPQQVPQEAPAQ